MPTSGPTVSSGRRGYLRYSYGEHFWIPEVLADVSKGMVRDTARIAIPDGSVYDATDYLLDQPGVARKRGGTSYAGPALTGASYVVQVMHVPFPAGSQLIAVGDNGHVYRVTPGATTDIGTRAGSSGYYLKPQVTPGARFVVFPNDGGTPHDKYDGTTFSAATGTPGTNHMAVYKSRLVGSSAASAAEGNRSYFSLTPDVNAAWDTANSWIDGDNVITGYAALNNALLIFSSDHTERIIGATPPPNRDMDRAPLAPIGCTDVRAIVGVGQYVYFANPQGVFLTNGSTPVSLTYEGGIATYWRSLFAGYSIGSVPSQSSWTIALGFWRGFLFASVLNASRVVQATLMCNVAKRAWWRLTNIKAMSWTTAADGNELWYGDAASNRVVAMSGIFNPAAANKNDADGTPVTPMIEFRPVGQGVGTKAYAWGHLDYDMRDAASDNPTMQVTVKTGIEADTSLTPPESPLGETSTLVRPRFQINRNAQAVTVALTQSGPSAKTELYALEVEQRQQSLVGEGVS